ncbi:MAG TPA: low molecular weight protein-tyrosine-phosphatase [Bacillota bacterium]|nr:low molecular weight protein-tyrosine-phosphatase [Bacillota bacterium]
MINVIFVCLGNICRSPLGEGIFRELVRLRGWENRFHIDSAGTASYHVGEAPDPGSRKVAKKHGISIDELRGRHLKGDELDKWNYIVAMDTSNRGNIEKLGQIRGELWLMRDFDPIEKGGSVPDPWSQGDDAFLNSYNIIYRSCEKLLEYIADKEELE